MDGNGVPKMQVSAGLVSQILSRSAELARASYSARTQLYMFLRDSRERFWRNSIESEKTRSKKLAPEAKNASDLAWLPISNYIRNWPQIWHRTGDFGLKMP